MQQRSRVPRAILEVLDKVDNSLWTPKYKAEVANFDDWLVFEKHVTYPHRQTILFEGAEPSPPSLVYHNANSGIVMVANQDTTDVLSTHGASLAKCTKHSGWQRKSISPHTAQAAPLHAQHMHIFDSTFATHPPCLPFPLIWPSSLTGHPVLAQASKGWLGGLVVRHPSASGKTQVRSLVWPVFSVQKVMSPDGTGNWSLLEAHNKPLILGWVEGASKGWLGGLVVRHPSTSGKTQLVLIPQPHVDSGSPPQPSVWHPRPAPGRAGPVLSDTQSHVAYHWSESVHEREAAQPAHMYINVLQ
ncbi:hypothetical protein EDD16DRAFT_1519578 [Pisolithus croceorrhizus]|nr:hypothetical protein EDD16DRAFT_1519578 [Pisolithus croceorrhizus]KAI6158803.1 hypothetical protein EDD17DRAFT_1511829 [Pisolithus thermaeus]